MKRLEYIDALRGWAIFTMILGHSIQQFNDTHCFLQDRVFSTIYAFHMPLFFFLSGLLFKNSLKQSPANFVKKKVIQLILPSIVWALIFYLVSSLAAGTVDLDFKNIKKLVSPSSWPFWFLVELFKSYLLLFFLYKIFKNQAVVFIIALSVVFLIHSQSLQRFLIPFFMLGIMTKDYISFFEKHLKPLLIGFFALFLTLLFFWKGSYTIYFSEFPEVFSIYSHQFSLKNYDIALFRFVIGLVGCIFWFLLFKYINERQIIKAPMKWFTTIGKETLGIYIIQKSLLELFLTNYIDFYSVPNWITSLVILPIISIVIIQIIMFIIHLINRNKTARLLLIGKE
ncbi:acyltransferase family protein [Epilithonimonas sp. JDS]|uniref:acyltransferase family protein n=1 Tax=Epilithonimonas sp. JDS TaxID=2902797 RepID=UPI001E2A5F6E|nr:acyltransferase family protein [Epilithonimonas sp. JDS]MCD9854165.1 acyltransferase family protein [Epilithonimonas sp. JDS]